MKSSKARPVFSPYCSSSLSCAHLLSAQSSLSLSNFSPSMNNPSISQLPSLPSSGSQPLTSAAKRRLRRKRNEMKRIESMLTATAVATAASIICSKQNTGSLKLAHLPMNCGFSNCSFHSSNDHFLDYNASSFKVKSCLRYDVSISCY